MFDFDVQFLFETSELCKGANPDIVTFDFMLWLFILLTLLSHCGVTALDVSHELYCLTTTANFNVFC